MIETVFDVIMGMFGICLVGILSGMILVLLDYLKKR